MPLYVSHIILIYPLTVSFEIWVVLSYITEALVITHPHRSWSTNPDILICPVDHFLELRIIVFKSVSIHNWRDDVGDSIVHRLSCVKWFSFVEIKASLKILQKRYYKVIYESLLWNNEIILRWIIWVPPKLSNTPLRYWISLMIFSSLPLLPIPKSRRFVKAKRLISFQFSPFENRIPKDNKACV